MAEALRQYHARAPRYVLTTDDQRRGRFAPMHTRGQSVSTQVLDVSETGLSFQLIGIEPPKEGELLKIEFTVPGRKQIAWYATVTRVESRVEWDPELGDRPSIKVAVAYHELPDAFRRSLKLGLSERVSDPDAASLPSLPSKDWLRFGLVAIALLMSLYWSSLPISAAREHLQSLTRLR